MYKLDQTSMRYVNAHIFYVTKFQTKVGIYQINSSLKCNTSICTYACIVQCIIKCVWLWMNSLPGTKQ